MRTATAKQVRELLRASADGLTIRQLNEILNRTECNLRRVLQTMPDTYIDRWESVPRQTFSAVWCVVIPPEDCPHPTKGTTR